MPAVRNLIGQRFGRLLVKKRAPIDRARRNGAARWVCECDCGTIKTIARGELTRGTTVSCGCFNLDNQIAKFLALNTTHGLSRINGEKNPIYDIWRGMVRRCEESNDKKFPHYGGRGIRVYPAWLDFPKFEADILSSIGQRPNRSYSLDRKDNDGNYEPGNVRWATAKQQFYNRGRKQDGQMNSILSMGC